MTEDDNKNTTTEEETQQEVYSDPEWPKDEADELLDDLLQSEAAEVYVTEDMEVPDYQSHDEDCEYKDDEESKERSPEEETDEDAAEDVDSILKSEPETPEENIATCLTEAATKTAKPVKYGVPFEHEYDTMRKQLQALIMAAKKHHVALCEIEKSRIEVATKLSDISEATPLRGSIGESIGNDSLYTFYRLACEVSEFDAAVYRKNVIDSLLAWEKSIKTKVDVDLAKIHRLSQQLDYNQSKVENITKKMKSLKEGKEVPRKLVEDLERYQAKIDQDLKTFNLLEEVVASKWKDMYPVVKAFMEWQIDHAAKEYDIFTKLPVLENELAFVYTEHSPPPGKTPSLAELDLAQKEPPMPEEDERTETSGSFDSHEMDKEPLNRPKHQQKWHFHEKQTM